MSLPTLSVPAAILALQDLIRVEEHEEKKVRLANKLSWWKDCLRVKGSTLPYAWKPTVILTLWATVVAVADFVYGREWRLANGVLPLLSVVVGLMLVFRNSSSFARWDQGRVVFTTLMSTTRSLCRNIWISVGARGPSNKDPQSDGLSPLEHRRKERCLRLIVAFVVAVKRHVRGEYGVDHDDLRALLPVGFYSADDTPGFGTAAFAFTSESEESQKAPDEASVSIQVDEGLTPPGSKTAAATSTSPLMSPQMPPSPRLRRPWESQRQELDEHAPLLARLPSKRRSSRSSSDSDIDRIQRSPGGSRPKPPFLSKPSLPLPLVIAHQIHLYLADAKSKGYLESVGPAGYNALVQALATMTDNFSQIEKLSALPIPAIYGIHMKQCTSLYLLALPLTLLDLGWILIPIVTIVAFTLIGIEALARECEDPFGFDSSDLPLNLLTAELRSEVEHMIERLGSTGSDLMI